MGMRRSLYAIVVAVALAAAPTLAAAQEARVNQTPVPPPSSLELRLQEHAAREQGREASKQAQAESRLRRLTGSGGAAGTRAVEQNAIGAVSGGTVVRVAIGGLLVWAAVAAFQATNATDAARQ